MNKRGITEEVLYDMFKLVISVLIFTFLVGIAWQLWFTDEQTPVERNLDVIVQEINALDKGETFEALATSSFKLILFGANNDEKRCAGRPCVCAVEPAAAGQAESWTCKPLTGAVAECDKGPCAPQGPPQVLDVTPNAPVVVCRAGQHENTLMIGTGCA
jgi:hypothetical protein